MSIIKQLSIEDLRNIKNTKLDFNSKYNLFYGNNGSGKTSILEAISLLSNGKSFRSSIKSRIINHEATKMVLFAKIGDKRGSVKKVGLEKSNNTAARLKIDGEICKRIADASSLLPVLLIDPNSYALLEDGPSERRQYLDWGLFHVKQSFHKAWQNFSRCLKQRNAALKRQLSVKECKMWDEELIVLAQNLDQMRQEYFEVLYPHFKRLLEQLVLPFIITADYYSGWDKSLSFAEALAGSFKKDYVLGYTGIGPHKADIRFTVANIPAEDVLSRGQTKLVVTIMQIAQGEYYQVATENTCIYLIDDLVSELDNINKEALYRLLESIKGQYFITSPHKDAFAKYLKSDGKMFHVKHGRVE